MASASIILPQKLLVKLKDKAEESDSLPDEGKEFLSRGDLVQAQPFKKALTENASLKLWCASATAVKSVAAKRGWKLEKQGALWHFVNTLAKGSGDKDLVRLQHMAYLCVKQIKLGGRLR